MAPPELKQDLAREIMRTEYGRAPRGDGRSYRDGGRRDERSDNYGNRGSRGNSMFGGDSRRRDRDEY